MSERDDNQEDGSIEEKLVQVIENQIENENPPATCAVFNKLILVGYERDEVLGMMVYVLAHKINVILIVDRALDGAGYRHTLRALLTLPGDEWTGPGQLVPTNVPHIHTALFRQTSAVLIEG